MTPHAPAVLIIESRFYQDIADELVAGAITELEAAGVRYDRVTVAGALEIPQALAFACHAGLMPLGAARCRYHGAVALGCVIRGETSHYDIVAMESARALMAVAINRGVPVGNGILTVDSRDQAWRRASRAGRNKGADAAQACLGLIGVVSDFQAAR